MNGDGEYRDVCYLGTSKTYGFGYYQTVDHAITACVSITGIEVLEKKLRVNVVLNGAVRE